MIGSSPKALALGVFSLVDKIVQVTLDPFRTRVTSPEVFPEFKTAFCGF
jgi:hypothetical protein